MALSGRGILVAGVVFAFGCASCGKPRSSSEVKICDPLVAGSEQSRLVGTAVADSEETEMLRLVNEYRASFGLSALRSSGHLTAAAQWMSRDMTEKLYLEHVDSLGRDVGQRLGEFGTPEFERMAENIANGNASAFLTFEQWRNSPLHEVNLRAPHFTHVGIARVGRESSHCHWYWTTEFGG